MVVGGDDVVVVVVVTGASTSASVLLWVLSSRGYLGRVLQWRHLPEHKVRLC